MKNSRFEINNKIYPNMYTGNYLNFSCNFAFFTIIEDMNTPKNNNHLIAKLSVPYVSRSSVLLTLSNIFKREPENPQICEYFSMLQTSAAVWKIISGVANIIDNHPDRSIADLGKKVGLLFFARFDKYLKNSLKTFHTDTIHAPQLLARIQKQKHFVYCILSQSSDLSVEQTFDSQTLMEDIAQEYWNTIYRNLWSAFATLVRDVSRISLDTLPEGKQYAQGILLQRKILHILFQAAEECSYLCMTHLDLDAVWPIADWFFEGVGNFEVKKFTAMQKQNQKILVNESSIHRHITQGILPFDAVLQAFLRSVITGESKNLIAEQKYVKLLPEMDFQLYKASAENSSSEIYCSRLWGRNAWIENGIFSFNANPEIPNPEQRCSQSVIWHSMVPLDLPAFESTLFLGCRTSSQVFQSYHTTAFDSFPYVNLFITGHLTAIRSFYFSTLVLAPKSRTILVDDSAKFWVIQVQPDAEIILRWTKILHEGILHIMPGAQFRFENAEDTNVLIIAPHLTCPPSESRSPGSSMFLWKDDLERYSGWLTHVRLKKFERIGYIIRSSIHDLLADMETKSEFLQKKIDQVLSEDFTTESSQSFTHTIIPTMLVPSGNFPFAHQDFWQVSWEGVLEHCKVYGSLQERKEIQSVLITYLAGMSAHEDFDLTGIHRLTWHAKYLFRELCVLMESSTALVNVESRLMEALNPVSLTIMLALYEQAFGHAPQLTPNWIAMLSTILSEINPLKDPTKNNFRWSRIILLFQAIRSLNPQNVEIDSIREILYAR
jgi:hypothetical protein